MYNSDRQLVLEGYQVKFDLYPEEQRVWICFAGYLIDAFLDVEKNKIKSFDYADYGEGGCSSRLIQKIKTYLKIIIAEWKGRAMLIHVNDHPQKSKQPRPALKVIQKQAVG